MTSSKQEGVEALLERTRVGSQAQAEALERVSTQVQELCATLRREHERLEAFPAGTPPERPGREPELEQLRLALGALQAENLRLAEQMHAAEHQLFVLMHAQVLMSRLQGVLARSEVLTAIQDLVVNLIGSEEVAILEASASGGGLALSSWSGSGEAPVGRVALGEGPVGLACAQGAVRMGGEGALSACVPLQVGGLLVGAVAIYRLLPHKAALTEADHEVLTQLGAQAATALYCAQLHERLQGAGR